MKKATIIKCIIVTLIATSMIIPTGCKRAAEFEVSFLVITPTEVLTGEPVTIKLDVTNTGDVEGIYTATLLVDGVAVETKEVEILGGEKVAVTFTLVKDVAGTYDLEVNGLSGRLTVLSPATVEVIPATFEVSSLSITPAEAGLGQLVTVTASVKNVGDVEGTYTACLIVEGVEVERKDVLVAAGMTQVVTFNITKEESGSYNVEIGASAQVHPSQAERTHAQTLVSSSYRPRQSKSADQPHDDLVASQRCYGQVEHFQSERGESKEHPHQASRKYSEWQDQPTTQVVSGGENSRCIGSYSHESNMAYGEQAT